MQFPVIARRCIGMGGFLEACYANACRGQPRPACAFAWKGEIFALVQRTRNGQRYGRIGTTGSTTRDW